VVAGVGLRTTEGAAEGDPQLLHDLDVHRILVVVRGEHRAEHRLHHLAALLVGEDLAEHAGHLGSGGVPVLLDRLGDLRAAGARVRDDLPEQPLLVAEVVGDERDVHASRLRDGAQGGAVVPAGRERGARLREDAPAGVAVHESSSERTQVRAAMKSASEVPGRSRVWRPSAEG